MTDHKTLTEALIAFQAELPDVSKGGTNPAFKSRYATLPDVTKAVFPVLARHGLAFTVYPDETDHGSVLRFELRHTSGEKIAGAFGLPDGAAAQEYGKWFTYFRRYVLSSITGITPDEDDDGNGASTPRARRQTAAAANVAIQKINHAANLDALRDVWEALPAASRALVDVLQAKDARKEQLSVPSAEAWAPSGEPLS